MLCRRAGIRRTPGQCRTGTSCGILRTGGSLAGGLILGSLLLTSIATTSFAREVDFSQDIRPILSDVCFTCHGPDEQQRVSDFRLDTRDGAFAPLEDGHAIVPGDAGASLLVSRILSDDPDLQMPPPDSGRTLSGEQRELLRQWIEQGAPWQDHWAFVSPQRPVVPSPDDADWCKNAIDHFVLAKLESAGLQPSAAADRHTLIRRVTLDLTGLPPTAAEVRAFVNDDSPNAWETVIDRLLQSPRYGEHMAIGWLDAARYADTSGYQTDGPRDMWRWRDWVIDAYNSNMPFDQFTVEQLAGDMLPDASLSQRIATGFNRNHRGNAEGGIIPAEYQVEYVVDRVDTTATVWLGLTMGCARCHDHKYDPISQKEFYEVFAFFNNIPESGRALKEGNSPPYVKAPTESQKQQLNALDERVAQAEALFREQQAETEVAQRDWEQQDEERSWPVWTAAAGLIHHFPLDDSIADAVPAEEGVDETPEEDEAADETPEASEPQPLPTFASGVHEGAAQFDGKQQPAVVGDVANFGYFDAFSVTMWISPTQSTGTIVSRMVPEEQGSGYYVQLEDGRLQVNLIKRWLDDCIRVESRDQLALNAWQHLTVTYDGSRVADGIRVYVDGERLDMEVRLDSINQSFATDEPFRIGGGQNVFSGMIDDVQVYDRVLTSAEASIAAVRESIGEILTVPDDQRSAHQALKLRHAFVTSYAPEHIRAAHRNVFLARTQRAAFFKSIPTVMVMQEMETRRPTHLLTRGQYDAPAEEVAAGVPSVFPPLAVGRPASRLEFARWLVDPGHPLTARVAVNRIWQKYFGIGLVKTTEDFGAQGDAPSHPQLLDWLAMEFVASGWDVKALHKLIVTSAAYQQASATSQELRDQDPENRLLARGPRFRLPAETVRDQALFVSGLLTEKVGGPSVRPYQPEGLWKEIASTTEYNQSEGEDLYRRSLYTYWKRTVAPPTMVTLDATARESCIVKRSRTNTPLQALALMNETTFVEAARVLAQCVMTSSAESIGDRLDQAFLMTVGRSPSTAERDVLQSAQLRYLSSFRDNPESASQLLAVGEAPRDDNLDAVELAAWTMTMSVILNLDEMITKE